MKVPSMKVLCALVLAAASLAVSAQELKIGYLNTERVQRESEYSKQADVRIKAEFKQREKDLDDQFTKLRTDADKLERDGPTLSETEKGRRQRYLIDADRDLQRKKREFQEDLNQRRNEEIANIQERANRAVKAISEAEHYDLIILDQAAGFASQRVDITDKVIRAMNALK